MDESMLLETSGGPRRRFLRSKFICPCLVVIGLTALTTAILISYFSDTYKSASILLMEEGIPLRILALNTWGMPETFGSKDKPLRMKAIGELVNKKEFDIYLFEELWLRKDHNTIHKHIPQGYHMTAYNSMNQEPCPIWDPLTPFACCDGIIGPSGCAGLAAVSRFPIKEFSFTMFNDHGPISGFEDWARKGFGRIQIEPVENTTVDVFFTHTCASDLESDKETREHQVGQLLKAIRSSEADFVLLGGDFNSDPRSSHETTYKQLKKDMSSSMEDFFKIISEWLIPSRATYGNPRNSYSSNYEPVLYDYIWHRARGNNLIITNIFDVPFLTTLKSTHTSIQVDENSSTEDAEKSSKIVDEKSTNTDKEKSANMEDDKSVTTRKVSLSDHEAISASLLLYKRK